MNVYFKRVLVLTVGWAFIALGIAGLFLPVLQGILFLLIGLVILSTEYVWAHQLLNKLRQRYPKLGHVADEATAKANRWMQQVFRHRGDN
ncbi:MAG: PGPGW domain-containing protein [Terriglobales bacterium]